MAPPPRGQLQLGQSTCSTLKLMLLEVSILSTLEHSLAAHETFPHASHEAFGKANTSTPITPACPLTQSCCVQGVMPGPGAEL